MSSKSPSNTNSAAAFPDVYGNQCRMLLIKNGKTRLPAFTVTVNGEKDPLKGKQTKDGHMEYRLPGNADIKVDIKRSFSLYELTISF